MRGDQTATIRVAKTSRRPTTSAATSTSAAIDADRQRTPPTAARLVVDRADAAERDADEERQRAGDDARRDAELLPGDRIARALRRAVLRRKRSTVRDLAERSAREGEAVALDRDLGAVRAQGIRLALEHGGHVDDDVVRGPRSPAGCTIAKNGTPSTSAARCARRRAP